jgi:hypothetical protein
MREIQAAILVGHFSHTHLASGSRGIRYIHAGHAHRNTVFLLIDARLSHTSFCSEKQVTDKWLLQCCGIYFMTTPKHLISVTQCLHFAPAMHPSRRRSLAPPLVHRPPRY